MRRHIMVPDVQVTPDTPTDHLPWIGEYIVEEKPDVVVQIGDFADLHSLSSYSSKKESEGQRLYEDLEASRAAMSRLLQPLEDYNNKRRAFKERLYKPEMHLTLGNHEARLERYIEDHPELEGQLTMQAFGYEDFGWTVHPFLDVVNIDGVAYSHFFCNPNTGKPYGGESVETRLKNIGFTFTMGHQQTLKSGQRFLSNGQRIRGLIAGSCYLHDETYRKQSNTEWRGIIVKNEVADGSYDLMEVSLDYLCRKYEGIELWEFMEKKYPEIFAGSTWLQRAKEVRLAA